MTGQTDWRPRHVDCHLHKSIPASAFVDGVRRSRRLPVVTDRQADGRTDGRWGQLTEPFTVDDSFYAASAAADCGLVGADRWRGGVQRTGPPSCGFDLHAISVLSRHRAICALQTDRGRGDSVLFCVQRSKQIAYGRHLCRPLCAPRNITRRPFHCRFKFSDYSNLCAQINSTILADIVPGRICCISLNNLHIVRNILLVLLSSFPPPPPPVPPFLPPPPPHHYYYYYYYHHHHHHHYYHYYYYYYLSTINSLTTNLLQTVSVQMSRLGQLLLYAMPFTISWVIISVKPWLGAASSTATTLNNEQRWTTYSFINENFRTGNAFWNR